MNRIATVAFALLVVANGIEPGVADGLPGGDKQPMRQMDQGKLNQWLHVWERSILGQNPQLHCSTEAGEEIGWKIYPFLRGFYHGYQATGKAFWVDRFAACTDAWLKRAVREPDGYVGWPKIGAAGTEVDNLDDLYADSMLGEAMALTPVVRMAGEIRKSPLLKERYGPQAENYIKVAEQIFEKWESRGAWRKTDAGGAITVVLPFGIDRTTGNWTAGYARRNEPEAGFSHPDNKANFIADWLLAMFDVTGKAVYREHAEKWFQTMKLRMKLKPDGTYEIWNYWQPAGAWDHKADGTPKHWIGVHPNAGYYDTDVAGIVAAFRHGLVFNNEDIDQLVKTAIADRRYWTALVPYDATIQKQFEDSVDPSSWSGLTLVPWYAVIQSQNALPQ
jgi:hypothetical protein